MIKKWLLYDLSQQVHYFAMVRNLKATGMLHEYGLCYQLRIANHYNIFMCKNQSGGSRGGSPRYFLDQTKLQKSLCCWGVGNFWRGGCTGRMDCNNNSSKLLISLVKCNLTTLTTISLAVKQHMSLAVKRFISLAVKWFISILVKWFTSLAFKWSTTSAVKQCTTLEVKSPMSLAASSSHDRTNCGNFVHC